MENCCRPALLKENWDDPPETEKGEEQVRTRGQSVCCACVVLA